MTTVAAGTVHCKTWKQIRKPSDGSSLWQFGQDGKFCYDGSLAWYGTYRGVSGYHNCGYNGGFLFSVSIEACKEAGNKTGQVRFNVNGHVAFVIKGSPVSYTYMPYVTGTKAGKVSMYYDYH